MGGGTSLQCEVESIWKKIPQDTAAGGQRKRENEVTPLCLEGTEGMTY